MTQKVVKKSCKSILKYKTLGVHPNAFDLNEIYSPDELNEINKNRIDRVNIEVSSMNTGHEKLYLTCESKRHPRDISYEFTGDWKKLPEYIDYAKKNCNYSAYINGLS